MSLLFLCGRGTQILLLLDCGKPTSPPKGKAMIKAKYVIVNEWNKDETLKHELEFETIGELEHFLSYNRNYILSLSFTGSFKKEEN